jgi:hypothetical protein
MKIGQAHQVDPLQVQLPQCSPTDHDRRQDFRANTALLKYLPDHLRRRMIKLRASCETDDAGALRRAIFLVC